MFSKFFITHPIFATVLAILMIIVGLVTVKTLPIAQYPDITPPTVMVSAAYPGADAKTVAETVGIPIEEQVNGVEGMMYMSSNSGADGSYSLTITFENGTDIDNATVKVQNRISMAEATLPNSVKEQGVQVSSRGTNILLFIALKSDKPGEYNSLYLTNYAQLKLIDELARVKGVGGASAFGAGEYSMRIWLNPQKMQVYKITTEDVERAIQAQNIGVTGGTVGAPPGDVTNPFQYTVTSQGRLMTAKQFANIIIKSDGDALLHLGDIAKVELGSESYSNVALVDNQEAGLIGIYQENGSNALEVAKLAKAKMEELSQYFPDGIHYEIVMDTTEFVDASIDEVLVTFIETTLIVMVVILIFLQNFRAVVIPMITIPVSLIATFAVMKLLGFSLNTLTLFGLVLAIAIVVDDAIVVCEDCQRIVDEGKLTPRQAAMQAMVELQGPVVGEVLVLLSVFIPTAFISGITGELYKQFALTIATSTAFSGFNALTFTPAMCALFLRPKKETKFFLYKWFNKGFGATLNAYMKIVTIFLKRPVVALGIFVVICVAAFWGFLKMPTSYVPSEDMGYFLTSIQLPTGASLTRTNEIAHQVTEDIKSIDKVKSVISITGMSFMAGGAGSNLASMFVVLDPWKERNKEQSVDAIIDQVYQKTAQIQEAEIISLNPPAIPGLGLSSGLQMQLLDINALGAEALAQAIEQVEMAAKSDPRLKSVTSFYEPSTPQYTLKINRDKVEFLGISLDDIYSSLGSFLGGTYVNDVIKFGRTYEVQILAQGDDRDNIQSIKALTVRNNKNQMVPFESFADIVPSMGEPSVSRYNMYQTASLTGTPNKGVSSSEGIQAMEEIVDKALGKNFSYAWTGEAYQETQSSTTIAVVLIFAIVLTILILAAQYESWTNPIAVVITMPTAILGTVVGCLIMHQDISIYTQIGIILLLGMSAKNAILIVEYAVDFRKQGKPLLNSAADAGRIRFRPIMMTALAFVFGILPMLFATGAGAASRISLGAAVVFGMAINALVGTLFVPNFWELFQRFYENHLSKLFAAADQVPKGDVDTNYTAPKGETDF